MNDGKRDLKILTLFSILLLSFPAQSSAMMPQFAETIREAVFPRVTVAIINEASYGVYLKCGLDRGNQDLQRLEPGQTASWAFYEILFPLRWCYVHINNQNRGAFWAFTVMLKCTQCTWSIRDDGAYHFDLYKNDWIKHHLYLE